MNNNLKGATIWARKTIESDIFCMKPDKWFKIWFYIISNVNHRDNGKFKRGEIFTNNTEISQATGSTLDGTKKCLVFLRKSGMIGTRRSTRGMYIKVFKYNIYQDFDTYKSTTDGTRKALEKHQRSTTINNNDNNENNISSTFNKLKVINNNNKKSMKTINYYDGEEIVKNNSSRKKMNKDQVKLAIAVGFMWIEFVLKNSDLEKEEVPYELISKYARLYILNGWKYDDFKGLFTYWFKTQKKEDNINPAFCINKTFIAKYKQYKRSISKPVSNAQIAEQIKL